MNEESYLHSEWIPLKKIRGEKSKKRLATLLPKLLLIIALLITGVLIFFTSSKSKKIEKNKPVLSNEKTVKLESKLNTITNSNLGHALLEKDVQEIIDTITELNNFLIGLSSGEKQEGFEVDYLISILDFLLERYQVDSSLTSLYKDLLVAIQKDHQEDILFLGGEINNEVLYIEDFFFQLENQVALNKGNDLNVFSAVKEPII